jgi:hypothetical protein
MSIRYKVECESCESAFVVTKYEEDDLSYFDNDDDMPKYCVYCGKPLDEYNIEEIE